MIAATAAPLLLLVLLQVSCSSGFVVQKACFKDLGCFSTGGNFYDLLRRPFQLAPESPNAINTLFTLYTRHNIVRGQRIVHKRPETVKNSNFDPKKQTKMIVHGFLETADTSPWMHALKRALLLHSDCNVILIDWSDGNEPPYMQATANTRVTGAVIAQLITWLEREFGAKRADFHILGHSLGSHIAGYAGERLNGKLGRITGLDPAGPYFENTHPEVRLDPTDAVFVDAIHTDGDSTVSALLFKGGLGLMQAVGHVDFYPNGGRAQPECSGNPILNFFKQGVVKGSASTVSCDHSRVTQLFISSALNAIGDYMAVPCASYQLFKQGKCDSCGAEGCAQMGINAIKWRPNGRKNVKMFLDTTGRHPFELHHYTVTLKVKSVSPGSSVYGKVAVKLQGDSGGTTPELVILKNSYISAGQEITAQVTSSEPVFHLSRLRVYWRNQKLLSLFTRSITIASVSVFEVFTAKTSQFCGEGKKLKSGNYLWLDKSDKC